MTMALLALEEIINRQQEKRTTVLCWSQTAPITHLEPGAQTPRGEVEPLVLRPATGCGDRDAPAGAPVCLYKSHPSRDSYVAPFHDIFLKPKKHFFLFTALSLVLMYQLFHCRTFCDHTHPILLLPGLITSA